MTITTVTVRKLFTEGPVEAIVSVEFDNIFVVHDIRVVKSSKTGGRFLSMPSRKDKKRERVFHSVAHPLEEGMRLELENAIYQAVDDAVAA